MRDPSAPRDQREIVVPSDMRAKRAAGPIVKRPPVDGRRPTPPGELRASLVAVAAASARFCRTRPGEVAGSLLAVAAAVVVSLNALGLQMGRHPAPILPRAETVAKPLPPKPAPPAARDTADAAPREARAADAPAAPAKPAARDAIADAIRAADETTASVGRRVEPKADPGVTRAQRALTKLGYGTLKADGMMGPGTRAAIEKFERERKIPVTGEAAGRTLRELAARAGLSG